MLVKQLERKNYQTVLTSHNTNLLSNSIMRPDCYFILTLSLIHILLLKIFALVSGLIIFPACFAFGVNPDSGFGLIFVTLPNIFNNMPLGQLWGGLFFIFGNYLGLLIPICFYNGQKGSISKTMQLGMYAFYPLHLLVLGMIGLLR